MTKKPKTKKPAAPVDTDRNTVLRWMFDQEAQGCRFELTDDDRVAIWHWTWPPEVEAFFQATGPTQREVLRSIPPAVM